MMLTAAVTLAMATAAGAAEGASDAADTAAATATTPAVRLCDEAALDRKYDNCVAMLNTGTNERATATTLSISPQLSPLSFN